MDYGTRKTDLAVRRAEWRLSRVYHQAAKDIDEKMKTWEKGHRARETMYRAQLAEGKITQADFDAWMRGQVFQGEQWKARKKEIEAVLYNADKAAANIVNEGKLGVFADNANYIGYSLEHDMNINSGFTLYDQATVARLVENDHRLLPPAKVQKDKAAIYYNKLVNMSVTQGIIQGETIPQIARRIAQTTGERSYNSAVRNARTAYTGAQNAGRIEGLHQAQELGIKVKKRWMATLDSRTRDAHADLDGQVQDVDEPFESELGEIMYPGDPGAEPGNVYNCRCTLVYDHPEYPSQMQRRDNETGEVIGDMTYREWEEWKSGKAGNTEPTARTAQSAESPTLNSAKDFDELESVLQSEYNITMQADIKSLDYATVHEAMQGVDYMLAKYPEIGEAIDVCKTSKVGAMSCTGEELTFNPKNFGDNNTLAKDCEKYGRMHWWPENSNIGSCGAHECAHGLEWVLITKHSDYQSRYEQVQAWNKCSVASKIVSEAGKRVKGTEYGKGKKIGELIESISGYATNTRSEAMAEAFADVYINGNNAQPMSLEIVRVTDEMYNRIVKGVTP